MNNPQGTSKATKRKKKDNSQRSVKRRTNAATAATIKVLTDNCLLKIFSYLELRDLGNLEQVSTRFRELARRSFSVFRNIYCDCDDGYDNDLRTLSEARAVSERVGHGLRRLSLSGEYGESLEMLKVFLIYCPNIEHFEFRYLPVQELGILKHLDDYFANVIDVIDIKIKSVLFDHCDLDDSQDAMFFRYLEDGTNFEDVSVTTDEKFTGKWLKYLENLKSIDLDSCSSLQPSHFIEFCKSNNTLVNLKVSTCGMNQKCVKTICEELKNLQSLAIDCSDFPKSANLSILGDLPKLQKLEIRKINLLALPLLKRLVFHNKLQVIKCDRSDATSEEEAEIFREIAKIQGLKSFHLHGFGSPEFSDEALNIFTMDKLEELEIQKAGVTNQGLFDFILRNPALKSLRIINCPWITDEFAQMIIPRLRTDFKSLKIDADDTRISVKNRKILLNY